MNEIVTTEWKYGGYTKVLEGKGRNTRIIERHVWVCPECGHEVKSGKNKPQHDCPCCVKRKENDNAKV